MQPELIIFDCDGVLIDSEGLAHQVLVDALAECGIHMSFAEALERFMGKSESHEYAVVEAEYGVTLPASFLDRKREICEKLFEKDLKPLEGIAALLDKLPIKKCVASGSSPERLKHSLSLTGLWNYFAPHIFSATQVKNGKPAPDLFLFAAEQMQTPADKCLVIEDSPAGVQAAKAAHMRVFGFIGGSHCGEKHADLLLADGAERVFRTMNDLSAFLSLPA